MAARSPCGVQVTSAFRGLRLKGFGAAGSGFGFCWVSEDSTQTAALLQHAASRRPHPAMMPFPAPASCRSAV